MYLALNTCDLSEGERQGSDKYSSYAFRRISGEALLTPSISWGISMLDSREVDDKEEEDKARAKSASNPDRIFECLAWLRYQHTQKCLNARSSRAAQSRCPQPALNSAGKKSENSMAEKQGNR